MNYSVNGSKFLPYQCMKFKNLQTFLESTKYEVIHTKSMRVLRAPNSMALKKPEKGSEIFVKSIPSFMFENELLPIFEEVGEIFEMRLMLTSNGTTRGCGFIRYFEPSVADIAIKYFNQRVLGQKCLIVKKSHENSCLHISGISRGIIPEEIRQVFTRLVPHVQNILILPSQFLHEKNTGSIFLYFKDHTSAAVAKRVINLGVTLWGMPICANWAVEIDNPEEVEQINDLFIRFPIWVHYRDIVNKINEIVPRNTAFRVKKLHEYAFLFFNNHQTAKMVKDNFTDLKGAAVIVKWMDMKKKKTYEQNREEKSKNFKNNQMLALKNKNFE